MKPLKIRIIVALLLFTPYFVFSQQKKQNNLVHITVFYNGVKKPERLKLKYFENALAGYNPSFASLESVKRVERDGTFKFSFNMKQSIGYFTILEYNGDEYNDKFMMHMYLAEKGDDIKLVLTRDEGNEANYRKLSALYRKIDNFKVFAEYVNTYNFDFSGKGAAKYKYRTEINLLQRNVMGDISNDVTLQSKADSLKRIYRNELSDKALGILTADEIGQSAKDIWDFLNTDNTLLLKQGHEQLFKIRESYIKSNFSNETIRLSRNISYYFIAEALAAVPNSGIHPVSVFSYLDQNFSGGIREKALINYTMLKPILRVIPDSILLKMSTSVNNPVFRNFFKREYNDFLRKGVPAKNFTLTDESGKTVKLSDFSGKVIVMDFWFTGCLGCANFYNNVLKPTQKDLEGLHDVIFISISIDKSKELWLKSLASGTYTSVGEVNLYTNGLGRSANIVSDYKVYTYPRVVVIDKTGKIVSDRPSELGEIDGKYDHSVLSKLLKQIL